MTAITPGTEAVTTAGGVELKGLEPIAESERKGRARDLFWPWFGANVSLFAIPYGAYLLGFGISFVQATVVGVVGIVVSFALCGVVSLAGRRGSAPTMVLSRAAFGVRGNRVPSFISWLLTVGWETALTATAVLATSTVITELTGGSGGGGVGTKIIALVIVAGLIVAAGIAGFDVIMRLQKWITIATAVLTIAFVVVAAPKIDLATVAAIPNGSPAAVLGALILMMTGFGLGWVNAAADYSRYLPRETRGTGIAGWTTLGGSLAPILLVVVGLLLVGSSTALFDAVQSDPIGALSAILPTWFLIPFAVVAVLGLVGGAVLDIYSSGLALLSAGLPVPRPVAAGVDGVIMVIGAVYVAFFATDFAGPFQGFLITLGVPIAAWCGVFVADVALRRRDYTTDALYDPSGRYGSVRALPLVLVLAGTVLGWGLVTNAAAPWLAWQGYLLGPIGGREGAWAYANLGVLVALLIGFVGTLVGARRAVARQEGRS